MKDKSDTGRASTAVAKKQSAAVANGANSTEQDAAATMLQMAMTNSDVDLQKMEKIMQMYQEVEAKKAERLYNAAMADLQGAIPSIKRDGIIPNKDGTPRSYYSKYETIMDAIQPQLTEHGIAISFRTSFENNQAIVKCVITHKDGHNENTTMTLPFDSSGSKNSVQAIGSSLSYAKRYALCLILNIPTGGEDDDGNSAEPGVKQTELQVLAADIIGKLEVYQGEDIQEIRDMCAEKKKAKEFTIEFAKEILKKIS